MAVRVVRLGSERADGEGLRIGTVRRPPRGVPKAAFAAQNWYDVWYPNLAPSAKIIKLAQQAATPAQWQRFARLYRAEMATPENRRTLDLLAALSQHSHFSVGCTAKTRRAATAPCCAPCWPSTAPSSPENRFVWRIARRRRRP
jgi:uncharacterized protein YeaO (DUF488 family)